MSEWETWVRSLGWEDPLQKEMATHSSIPAWRIPWTEEPGGLQPMEQQESNTTWQQNNNNSFSKSIKTSSRHVVTVKITKLYT